MALVTFPAAMRAGYTPPMPPIEDGPELERDRVRARAIFESAVDGMITIDETSAIRSVNPAALRIFGYEADEVLGENVKMLMPEPHHSNHDDYVSNYLRTGEKRIIGKGREVEGRRKDGSTFPMDLAVSELRLGDSSWFLGIVRDVTTRQETAEELRRERDFAESLVETAQAIVLVLDAEGRIVRFNRYMEEISGIPLEEVRGKNWFQTFIPPSERARIRGVFDTSLLGSPTRGNVNAILTASGEQRDIEWFDTVLRDTEGNVSGILAVGQDLTPRRALEEQVRQAQKLEAIGRLAGGIAHDFNTLLGSIAGYAEILAESLEDDADQHKAARQIVRAAERGAALTRQLLAFSRRQVLYPKVVDLNAVVEDMGGLLQRLVDTGVELARRLADERLPVRVDATQVEQVIMNLVINACDAMPDGGRIEIATCRSDASRCSDCTGGCCQLRVSDTGIGMDDKTKSRIFDPFFTTKETGKGTGLGLATVYGIVTQSHGRVRVESRVGEGSSFIICFPYASEEDAADDVAPRDLVTGLGGHGNETILLVEDDLMFRNLLAEVLEKRGYRVWVAEDAAEALALYRRDETLPDLLVSDISMPGEMNGSDLATTLRAEDATLPVLLMSGYTDETLPADDEAGAETGPSKFIQKPFSTADFLAAVRELLSASDDDSP
ncbi:MAG: PAS domain S-box protein [Thermoanaerobaculia bacterium]|nr:PAS domain S-box protein [Thermoanaerobaculia bacterium]